MTKKNTNILEKNHSARVILYQDNPLARQLLSNFYQDVYLNIGPNQIYKNS